VIKRSWVKGDKVELNFKLEPKVIVGDHLNEGKVAFMYGPLVLAADEALLGTDLTIGSIAIGSLDLALLGIKPEPAPEMVKNWSNAQTFHLNAVISRNTANAKAGSPIEIQLIPFADGSSTGKNYKVWLPLLSATINKNRNSISLASRF